MKLIAEPTGYVIAHKLTNFGIVPVILRENLDKNKICLHLKWDDNRLFKPEVHIPRGEIKGFLRFQYEIDKLFVNIRNKDCFYAN